MVKGDSRCREETEAGKVYKLSLSLCLHPGHNPINARDIKTAERKKCIPHGYCVGFLLEEGAQA